jgi:hypothetical protein
MFAWFQHLCDDRYFNSIEVFYLFAGHTHSPLDQNFSVVNKAIKRAEFIGSTIAMQELFKLEQKSKASRITDVITLDIYHDYVKYYDPVINNLVHYFGGPHRFLIEYQKQWGLSDVVYMWQSPDGWDNAWLPSRPAANIDSFDLLANIEISQYVSFGGNERMLKSCGLESTLDVGAMFSATSQSSLLSVANKVSTTSESRPKIIELENRSLVEQEHIYQREAAQGKATSLAAHRVRVTGEMIASIEKVMLSENSKTAGHLLFLKRSNCSDPNHLKNSRPQVLPNPKIWRQQVSADGLAIQNANRDDESQGHSVVVIGDSTAASTGSAAAVAALSANISMASSSGQNQNGKKTKKDPVKDMAVTRLLAFNSGAAQMARTARHMLELKGIESRISTSKSMDIPTATRTFKLPVLTQRDLIFYENISSVARVSQAVERLVDEAEALPWELLRLPHIPELENRRAAAIKEQEAIHAKKNVELNRLFNQVHEGFDITRELITRDGKETIFAKTLEDMTMDQLKIIARSAAIKGRSNFKTKQQYFDAIKLYLSEHPQESLKSLCGEEDGADADRTQRITSASSSTINVNASSSTATVTEQPVNDASSDRIGGTRNSTDSALPTRTSSSASDRVNQSHIHATTAGNDACEAGTINDGPVGAIGSEDVTTSINDNSQSSSESLAGDTSSESSAMALSEEAPCSAICPVAECEEPAVISCATCQLSFCAALHGGHHSHGCQQLKAGFTFPPNTWSNVPPAEEELFLDLTRKTYTAYISSLNSAKETSPVKLAVIERDISILEQKSAAIDTSMQTMSPSRKRKQTEETPVIKNAGQVPIVAAKIRKILEQNLPRKETELNTLLEFVSYDVSFLNALSIELHVSLSDAVNVRRPTREGVKKMLISKLL